MSKLGEPDNERFLHGLFGRVSRLLSDRGAVPMKYAGIPIEKKKLYTANRRAQRVEAPKPAIKPIEIVRAEREKRQAETEAFVAAAAPIARRIILMNMELPDGTKLRDATFAQCKKAGGWWLQLAGMGKPKQIVGETLSEADLGKIKF